MGKLLEEEELEGLIFFAFGFCYLYIGAKISHN